MKSLLTLLMVIASAGFAQGTAQAADQPQAQSALGNSPIVMLPAAAPIAGCDVGNLESPTYNYGNWITGNDAYAYLIQPQTEGCGCENGFQLDRVYMMMQFGFEDVPANFDVYATLREADWDETAGVFRPGQEFCRSATWSLTAATAGLYDIYVDLDGVCPCATAEDAYFVTFHLPQGFVWWPDALEDNTPDVGVSYYDGGSGWQDLVADYGWFGNNIMHAAVTCCDSPVGTEDQSWGRVKSLFR